MVNVLHALPSVGVATARARAQRQHAISALCSITLHAVLIALCASVVVQQRLIRREVIRLTLLGDRGGGTPGRAAALAALSSVTSPRPVEAPPVAAAVKKPAVAIKPRVAERRLRAAKPAVVNPAPAPDVALEQDGSPSSATFAASGLADVGAGSGLGAGGEGGGRGSGASSGNGRGGDRMKDYLATLRARIERSKRYPLLARRQGVEGRVAVAFEVTATGQVRHLRLADGTHPLLGQAALSAIEGAAPFPQLPADLAAPPLQVEIALRFSLEEP